MLEHQFVRFSHAITSPSAALYSSLSPRPLHPEISPREPLGCTRSATALRHYRRQDLRFPVRSVDPALSRLRLPPFLGPVVPPDIFMRSISSCFGQAVHDRRHRPQDVFGERFRSPWFTSSSTISPSRPPRLQESSGIIAMQLTARS
jgi:hypothetical protein